MKAGAAGDALARALKVCPEVQRELQSMGWEANRYKAVDKISDQSRADH